MLKVCYRRLVVFLERRRAFALLRAVHISKRIWEDPFAAPAKVYHKIKAKIENRRRMWADRVRSTYGEAISGNPRNLFKLPAAKVLEAHAPVYAFLAAKTLQHEFDLLGSGWVNLQRGLQRQGVGLAEGGGGYPPYEEIMPELKPQLLAMSVLKPNRNKAVGLWRQVGAGYVPISWNEDFKSGWVWPADTFSALQKYGDKPGADIKVPWELSRMHQLPWLAIASALGKGGLAGFANPTAYVEEFQNQILDFAASCPPSFGANWVCTMDVAIRASNIVAAHDFFCDQGVSFPPGFKKELLRILSDHFEHIINHLEYQPKIRANHYYSDIVGLLILSAWLPKTPKVVAALAWSINEFFKETILQFHPEGTNFEASTSYHRLCSELMYYALAVVKGLDGATLAALKDVDVSLWQGKGYYPVPPLEGAPEQNAAGIIIPQAVLARACLASDFSLACRMEPGEVLQVGDNDSGRLFKFLPSINMANGMEIINDHAHLLAAAWGLTAKKELADWANLPDSAIINLLAGKSYIACPEQLAEKSKEAWKCFSEFGLYFKKINNDVLAVRCGHNGQYDNGGHAHNDQLSVAFARNEILFLVDPGTYLYTPIPAWRNSLRSTCHHNTVFLPDTEQNDFSPVSLFTLSDQAKPKVLKISENSILSEHYGFEKTHRREIECGNTVLITDYIDDRRARIALHLHPGVTVQSLRPNGCTLQRNGVSLQINIISPSALGGWIIDKYVYSSGYGLKEPAPRLVSPPFEGSISWEIL